jgi:hypothetical protein
MLTNFSLFIYSASEDVYSCLGHLEIAPPSVIAGGLILPFYKRPTMLFLAASVARPALMIALLLFLFLLLLFLFSIL